MALFTRLKTIYRIESYLRLNLICKRQLHSVFNPSKAPCLRPHNVAPMFKRNNYFFEIFRKPSQRELKIKDDVPDAFQLIYRNIMSKYLLAAQVVSLIAGGLVCVAFIFKSEYKVNQGKFHQWSSTARTTENEELFYISFLILFLVLMQVMISRTPIRIYKVPGTSKYISVGYGNYLLGKEKYSFKAGEVTHMEEKGILPWRENKYVIQTETDRRVIILLDHYFRRPADLNIMLGEQKDPDLEE